jgi:hypothetical protein
MRKLVLGIFVTEVTYKIVGRPLLCKQLGIEIKGGWFVWIPR